MALPQGVANLIQKFDQNRLDYQDGSYKELRVRVDFIDPLFRELGWEMDNSQGFAEAFREVVHEDALRMSERRGAPDYCFRVGGNRKFFLEAKKPSVNLKDSVSPAFQVRSYAWTAELPISILTDFQEFAVYDCRAMPHKDDPPSTARLFYCTYKDYEDKWAEIASLFSKRAVESGSFDQYVISQTGKKGSLEVDSAFLQEISRWREDLARDIAQRNRHLSQRELNYAVQQIIDRIIFLRICEGRMIESEERMKELADGTDQYKRLCNLFLLADDRYNSGLFHFAEDRSRIHTPDKITLGLAVGDEPLRKIFNNLYTPNCPYRFDVIGADILGRVYEQFLGRLITLSDDREVTIDRKPDVVKAGGVYYTPAYVVRNVVRHSVRRLLDDRSIAEVSRFAVLDPACGSGSFLIAAYECLLDWYLEKYVEEGWEKHSKGKGARIHKGSSANSWRLTVAERKRILLQHIYGVDIDAQAVEVAKLSLLLKVLEGESDESVTSQGKLFRDRVLPNLDDNIKCGNSLIDTDFYEERLDLDSEGTLRANAFSWRQGFPNVFVNGGFQAVVGNPPWGSNIDEYLSYYHLKYPMTTRDHTDSFKLFIDRSISLLAPGGICSLVVPSTLLRQRRLMDVRLLLLQNQILSLTDLGENVFKGVVAPSCVFSIQQAEPTDGHLVALQNLSHLEPKAREIALSDADGVVLCRPQIEFQTSPDLAFVAPPKEHNVPVRLLGELDELKCRDAGINYQRVGTGMQDKGKSDLAERLLYEGEQQDSRDKMYWKGTDIDRYSIKRETNRYCRPYYREFLRASEVVTLNTKVFETTPKILLRQTSDRPIATIDTEGVWFGRSVIAILMDSHSAYKLTYFLGLLNSKYLRHLYHELAQEPGRVFAQVKLTKLKQLPFRTIDFADSAESALHDRLAGLVDEVLQLSNHISTITTPHELTVTRRQLASKESLIDELVYKLYGLSEDEVSFMQKADRGIDVASSDAVT